MDITMIPTQMMVADAPNMPGMKMVKFIEQNGNAVVVVLDEKAAQAVGAQLRSGIVVATTGDLPKADGAKRA